MAPIRRCVLAAILITAGCAPSQRSDAAGGASGGPTAGASGGAAPREAGAGGAPACPLKPGTKFAPDTLADGTYVESCNDWDDDCDGLIDEGLDKDGDGYSSCETADELPADCDDTKPYVNQGHEELCDGFDNDCDGSWDEGHDPGCALPMCSFRGECPEGLVCIERGEPCAVPAECPETTITDAHCAPPANLFSPGLCDPSKCGRFQDGTCAGWCACEPDGLFRWQVDCTE